MPVGAISATDRPPEVTRNGNPMKPVRRNATRHIAEIRQSTTRVTTKHPQYGYQPCLIRPETVWAYFEQSAQARLIDHEDGTYSIIDGSVWYRIYT